MNFKFLFCLLAVAMFSTACSQSQKAKTDKDKVQTTAKLEVKKDTGAYACLVGKDLRTIEVDKTKKRCEVHYTKFGEKSQVAWAEATPDICKRVTNQIRTNIESKGFKCGTDLAKLIKQNRKTASH